MANSVDPVTYKYLFPQKHAVVTHNKRLRKVPQYSRTSMTGTFLQDQGNLF